MKIRQNSIHSFGPMRAHSNGWRWSIFDLYQIVAESLDFGFDKEMVVSVVDYIPKGRILQFGFHLFPGLFKLF